VGLGKLLLPAASELRATRVSYRLLALPVWSDRSNYVTEQARQLQQVQQSRRPEQQLERKED